MRTDIPIQAVNIDGIFIEDVIEGYTTVKTTGREGLEMRMETVDVGSADGQTVKYTAYESRTVTVEFFLSADSMPELHKKLDHLHNLLTSDERDFIFNDEDDKYITGIPYLNSDFTDYKNAIKGTYSIYCPWPFKRSLDVYESLPTSVDGNSATFVINYKGNFPAKPILHAEFAGAQSGGTHSDDGDCGYIAFIDANENVIQLGNPNAVDFSEYEADTTLVAQTFSSVSGFAQAGKSFDGHAIDGSISNGSIKDTYYNGGKGTTYAIAKPTYGADTTKWHGPSLSKAVSDVQYFNLSVVQKLAVTNNAQVGQVEVGAYAEDGTLVAGYIIEKTGSGTNGTVRYIVDGKQVGSNAIDLSQYNPNFGYTQRTAKYVTQYYNTKTKKWQTKKIAKAKTKKVTSGYTYSKVSSNAKIVKTNSNVTFTIGGLATRTFATTSATAVTSVNIHYGQNKAIAPFALNGVNYLKMVASKTGLFSDTVNVFTAGDVVEADTYDASVTLRSEGTEDGQLAPQLGALGNDWEDFKLEYGANVITAIWSDWVDSNYKPTLSILYNEVFK